MKSAQRLTAIIGREDCGFVALCSEFDIVSESAAIEEARANLIEAWRRFLNPHRLLRWLGDLTAKFS